MALRAPYCLGHSEFNEFLFAPIGEERNGMTLSVLSALARLDIDPWLEAERLSELSGDCAVLALDGLIGRLSEGRWEKSETKKIAARLIDLLPQRGRRSA